MRDWGLLAQFAGPNELMDAVRRLRKVNNVAIEAFTPLPIEDLNELLPLKRSPMPLGDFARRDDRRRVNLFA